MLVPLRLIEDKINTLSSCWVLKKIPHLIFLKLLYLKMKSLQTLWHTSVKPHRCETKPQIWEFYLIISHILKYEWVGEAVEGILLPEEAEAAVYASMSVGFPLPSHCLEFDGNVSKKSRSIWTFSVRQKCLSPGTDLIWSILAELKLMFRWLHSLQFQTPVEPKSRECEHHLSIRTFEPNVLCMWKSGSDTQISPM